MIVISLVMLFICIVLLLIIVIIGCIGCVNFVVIVYGIVVFIDVSLLDRDFIILCCIIRLCVY